MKTFLYLLLATSTSYAASYGTFGSALAHPSNELSAVKFVEFGVQEELKTFDYRLGLGGWTDKSSYPGVQSSPYMLGQLGLTTRPVGGIYAGYFVGPAVVANTDRLLGSVFEVIHALSIGFKDTRGVKVGITIRHFSSGGLSRRNTGRDLVGLEVQF